MTQDTKAKQPNIKFIRRLNGRIIPNDDQTIDGSGFWDTEINIRKMLKHTYCPNHGRDSSATIMILFENIQIRWDFAQFCCEKYAELVEKELSKRMIRQGK
jgi:hypothetical protein